MQMRKCKGGSPHVCVMSTPHTSWRRTRNAWYNSYGGNMMHPTNHLHSLDLHRKRSFNNKRAFKVLIADAVSIMNGQMASDVLRDYTKTQ